MQGRIIKSISSELLDKYDSTSSLFFGIKNDTEKFIRTVKQALYPEIYYKSKVPAHIHRRILHSTASKLKAILRSVGFDKKTAESAVESFMYSLSALRSTLDTDVDAAYEGDPAASDRNEILLVYPSFQAVLSYRVAHELYKLNVPLIPRLIAEQAHTKTGIDIHPGAEIGDSFFIDHGTGVVIGETTVIGHNVRLYHNVTLGARSLSVDCRDSCGKKRHPNIGNNVIIYAGTTILGGKTCIGDNCIIGGNVWLTHSVEAGCTVVYDSTCCCKNL